MTVPIRLVIKKKGGVQLIALEQIVSLEADGNAVVAHTDDRKSYRFRESLSDVFEKLCHYGFIRIHRGVVVRSSAIVAVEKGLFRKAFVVLRTGAKHEVGRNEFRRLRPLWAGGIVDLRMLERPVTVAIHFDPNNNGKAELDRLARNIEAIASRRP